MNDMVRGVADASPLFLGVIMQDRLLRFFSYDHLPDHLQKISRPFHDLAWQMVASLPSNPEITVALRKLMEAKDAAVRCMLDE